MGAIDHYPGRGLAEALLPLEPVHPALPRAKLTPLENCSSLLDPLGQFALFFQLRVTGLPLLSLDDFGKRGERGQKQIAPSNNGTLKKIPAGEFHIQSPLSEERNFR
jgi:hypothetical protein